MNKHDLSRNLYMLKGPLAEKGYDWWWHNFTGTNSLTGEKKAFFIEYFIINPALGSDEPIFGENGVNKPSYVMVKAGCWGKDAKQLHSFYPINELHISENKLNLIVGDCFLTEKAMKGQVVLSEEEKELHPEYMSDSGEMSWDISIRKKIAYQVGYGASSFFRNLNAFEMFWHVEGMKTEYEGSVILDGTTYDITYDTSFGYADKNWGGDFTSPWVWLSSCNLVSKISGKQLKNSAFDIGGGRPKVFGASLDRKLLIDFYYESKEYEFNFSKFWTLTRTKFKCNETEDSIIWKVKSQNKDAVIEVLVTCKKEEMLLVNYEAPNGLKLHNRLWNGGTGTGIIKLYRKEKNQLVLIDEISAKNIGCEYGEYS